MTQPDEHLSAFLACIEALEPNQQVGHACGIVVPILEHLGYSLARETGSSVATSAFILAAEMEKRMVALQRLTEPDETS